MTTRSNWGRWGPDDQLGALNLLTEERVAAALARPRMGRTFALGTEVGRRGPLSGGRNTTWHVTVQVTHPRDPGRGRAEDMLTMHTHAHTHLDGLAHVWKDHQLYNGADASLVSRGGTKHAGVEHIGAVVATAIVLDVAAGRTLAEGDLVTASDLEESASRVDLDPDEADVFLVRTGWMDVHREDPERFASGEPGLSSDGAEWLAARDPVLVGMDNFGIEPIPAPEGTEPLFNHELFLRDLGVNLIENLDLAAVADAGVGEGLFFTAPLKIRRGLGSPLNPILVV